MAETGMKSENNNSLKIVLATVVVVGVIAWLAISGMNADGNKSYYVTIAEMRQMGEKTFTRNLRVEGFVKPDSIKRDGSNVSFTLTEFESHNPKATPNPKTVFVRYIGAEPPPDTFKDDAQALAVGKMGRDGVFHATELQAKCASKYQVAPPNTAGTVAAAPTTKKS